MSRPDLEDDAGRANAPHLVLVGLPGSGKSTVAPLLAAMIGREALDFDAEIARREGQSVAEIFAQDGEERFRALEHALSAELRDRAGMVLSPGGGWLSRPGTVALLRPPARLVYLRVRPATALRRMGSKVARRPLLAAEDPAVVLQRLLHERRQRYESADLVVDVDDLTPQGVARLIASRVAF